MAFRKKVGILEEFQPDIAIIQECENEETILKKGSNLIYNSYIWKGNNSNKGLGILTFNGFKAEIIEDNDDFKYVIPVKAHKDNIEIIILAIRTQFDKNIFNSYVVQAARAFKHYSSILDKENIVIIGDFNSNSIRDNGDKKEYTHSQMIKILENKNILSLYHHLMGEKQGQESTPTLYLHRNQNKPYHVDYCFIKSTLQDKVTDLKIGDYNTYINENDHMPLLLTLKI